MRINSVQSLQLTRRFERPQRNSREERTSRSFTFVIVRTDAGITGVGEACGDGAILPAIVEKRLGPMSIGLDPCDIDAVWKKLFASRAFWEGGGSVLCGISAIEIACWDIKGQAEGVPVCELLGGRTRDWIEAYASDLHWEEPVRMAEKAASYVEQGFRAVKTHLGSPGEWDRDLQRADAIRNAIGPDVGFMIDMNTVFSREEALEFGKAITSFNPFWYEEPLSPFDAAGHAELRKRLPMKIATGENLYLPHGFEPLWMHDSCDVAMPDIMRCGGLLQTREICRDAVRHGVLPSPHNYSSGVGLAATLHLMASISETQWLEFDPTGTAVYEELFIEPLVVEKGKVRVPTTPGLGVRVPVE